MFEKIKELAFPALLAVGVFVIAKMALAADPGTITNGSGTSYAQFVETEVGAVNFAPDGDSISVGSSSLTGYAWGDYVGWINMNPTNGGVSNDRSGNLSGYAWGEIIGYINFNPTNGGVSISTSTGEFGGYAWAENFGWLEFACPGSACVVTTWRPSTEEETSGGGGGGSAPRVVDDEETPTAEIIVPTLIPITITGEQAESEDIYSPEQPLTFPRNLKFGDTGNDAQVLQEFLIKGGYMKAGFNTGYFGPLTRAAVIAYQKANNITPAVGFFGPITRASVEKKMLETAKSLRPAVVKTTPPTTVQTGPMPIAPFKPFAFPTLPSPQEAVVSTYTSNLFGFPDIISTVAQISNKQIESPVKQVTPLIQVVPKIFNTVSKAIGSFFSAFGR